MFKQANEVEKQHKLCQNRKKKQKGELKPKMSLNVTLRDDGGCFQVKELRSTRHRLLVSVSPLLCCTWLFPNISAVELYMSTAGGGRGALQS